MSASPEEEPIPYWQDYSVRSGRVARPKPDQTYFTIITKNCLKNSHKVRRSECYEFLKKCNVRPPNRLFHKLRRSVKYFMLFRNGIRRITKFKRCGWVGRAVLCPVSHLAHNEYRIKGFKKGPLH